MIPLSTDPLKNLKRYAMLFGFAIMLAVVTLTSLYVWGLKRKVEKLEEQSTTAIADRNASDAWRRGAIVVSKDREEATRAADEVLDRNRDWADEPVPSDVADLLRNRKDAGRRVP